VLAIETTGEEVHVPGEVFAARSVYDLRLQAEKAQGAQQAPSAEQQLHDEGTPLSRGNHAETQDGMAEEEAPSSAPDFALHDVLPLSPEADQGRVEGGSRPEGKSRGPGRSRKRTFQKVSRRSPGSSQGMPPQSDLPDVSIPSNMGGGRLAQTDPFGNPWPVAPPPITTKWLPPPPLEDLVNIAAPKVKATPISGGFVKANGTHFVLAGKVTYFAGIFLVTILSKGAPGLRASSSAGRGLNVFRVWVRESTETILHINPARLSKFILGMGEWCYVNL
jgi:hypothetical protein